MGNRERGAATKALEVVCTAALVIGAVWLGYAKWRREEAGPSQHPVPVERPGLGKALDPSRKGNHYFRLHDPDQLPPWYTDPEMDDWRPVRLKPRPVGCLDIGYRDDSGAVRNIAIDEARFMVNGFVLVLPSKNEFSPKELSLCREFLTSYARYLRESDQVEMAAILESSAKELGEASAD